MKRLKLTVAYDGTNYCGWQIQPNGITVEEVLNRALRKLTGEEITVIGASRTDSGVHALGNVAVFDSETSIPPERISYALNQRLPDDIVVIRSEEVPADWHPRYCNSKTYEYHILNAKIPDPTRRLTRHFVSFDLDIEKMKKAAQYLVGTHDFVSFCNVRTDVEDTVRTIYSLDILPVGDEITIRIQEMDSCIIWCVSLWGHWCAWGGILYPGAGTGDSGSEEPQSRRGDSSAAGLFLVGIEYEE